MRWALLLFACGCATAHEPMTRAEAPAPWERWDPAPAGPLPDVEARPVPASLTPRLRGAWSRVLALGWPDPRAGEPHEVEVFDSSVWSVEPEVRPAIGFVLPHAPGARPFAIVDGSLYPLVALGPPVDLAAECERLMEGLVALGPEPTEELAEWFEQRRAVMARCPVDSSALFLADSHPGVARALDDVLGPFGGSLADAWVLDAVQRAFERAVTAFMRADDTVARYEAHLVVRGWDEVFESRSIRGSMERLEYLEGAEALAADLDRRAARGTRPPLPAVPAEGPVPAELVPALVDLLDEVQETQMSQPGGVALHRSPIVDALIRAGDAAVPALIDALEDDHRLTRSVHFWRDFVPDRTVLGAHEAAYTALAEILGASFFEAATTGDDLTARGDALRAALAARIRTFWEGYGRGDAADRRYRVLAADDVADDLQVAAARWLTTPEGGYVVPGSMVFTRWVEPVEGPMAGEPLRSGRDPSVTELLALRMNESEGDYRGFERACAFASALTRWDPTEAPARLAAFGDRCLGREACACAPSVVSYLGTTALIEAYAARLRRATQLEPEDLAPLVQLDDRPAMIELIDWLFDVGPFAEARLATREISWRIGMLVEVGALESEAFRAHLARMLDAESERGLYTERDGQGWIVYRDGSGTIGEATGATPHPLRCADHVARALAPRLAVPFSPAWDQARRDAAIARMRDALQSGRPGATPSP
ncbi:MAG: hypothetical protein H6719_11445 [Sandaracinaceae bacterium]|nr:hypothetical protein [Sandaracinaceae bacterium]